MIAYHSRLKVAFCLLALLPLALGQAIRANCFDYTVTQYDSEAFNDLGFTTALTLAPLSQCEVDVFTGIARFVYAQGLQVQMYSFNSIGQNVSLGAISNA